MGTGKTTALEIVGIHISRKMGAIYRAYTSKQDSWDAKSCRKRCVELEKYKNDVELVILLFDDFAAWKGKCPCFEEFLCSCVRIGSSTHCNNFIVFITSNYVLLTS